MKHFILSFRHLMLLAIMFFCITASAYDFEVDGMYYNIVSLSDLTCEVTRGDNEYTGDVVIPSTVTYKNKTLTITSIGEGAFSRNFNLTSVKIPYSVTSIKDWAFTSCKKLTKIIIPNSVTSIGNLTFSGCSNLKKVVLEEGDADLELGHGSASSKNECDGLFFDCPIDTLWLGRNITYKAESKYGLSPFALNTSIKSVIIGDSVTSIGKYAFSGCSGLTSFTIPSTVASISDYAFYDCTGVKSIIFEDGESILKIGYNANAKKENLFADCPIENLYIGRNLSCDLNGIFSSQSALKEVTLSNNVTSITNSEFYGCTALTNITIPNSVTSIGNYAFYLCGNLTTITIPNSVTSIGSSAFDCCFKLTSLTIPNTITSIEELTFYNCVSLTRIIIGNSVSSIGYRAFEDCSALTSITSLNPTPPTVGKENFTNKQYMDMVVYVPREAVSAYQSTDTWKNFWNIQGIDVTGIQRIETTKQTPTAIYDLQGRKLTKPKKGINIINGKKVLVK